MKIFKKILGNQKGVSLLEVMIAGAMAVATSVVVMKVSENANKNVKKFESDNELIDLERYLISSLTNGDSCLLTMDPYDLIDPASSLTDADAPQQYGDDTLKYTEESSFTLVTRTDPPASAGADPTVVASEDFVVGQPVPKFPLWIVNEIRVYEIADRNAANEGVCQVLFRLDRNVGRDGKRMSGVVGKTAQVAMNCRAASGGGGPNEVAGCSAINGLANSFWTLINSADPSKGIQYGGSPNARVYAKTELIVGNDPSELGGATAANATLDVYGDAHINDNLTIQTPGSGGLNSPILRMFNQDGNGGTIQFRNTWMEYSEQARFLDQLHVAGFFHVWADAQINGNTTIEGNGTIEGDGTILGNGRVDGNLHVGGYVRIDSDERLKEDKKVIERASDRLNEIAGYTYVLRRNGEEHIGFMAQELQKVFPQAVHQGEDGYLSVAYHMLIPVLVEAHKEQKAVIKDQQAEIDKLNGDVRFLYQEIQELKRNQNRGAWPAMYP